MLHHCSYTVGRLYQRVHRFERGAGAGRDLAVSVQYCTRSSCLILHATTRAPPAPGSETECACELRCAREARKPRALLDAHLGPAHLAHRNARHLHIARIDVQAIELRARATRVALGVRPRDDGVPRVQHQRVVAELVRLARDLVKRDAQLAQPRVTAVDSEADESLVQWRNPPSANRQRNASACADSSASLACMRIWTWRARLQSASSGYTNATAAHASCHAAPGSNLRNCSRSAWLAIGTAPPLGAERLSSSLSSVRSAAPALSASITSRSVRHTPPLAVPGAHAVFASSVDVASAMQSQVAAPMMRFAAS